MAITMNLHLGLLPQHLSDEHGEQILSLSPRLHLLLSLYLKVYVCFTMVRMKIYQSWPEFSVFCLTHNDLQTPGDNFSSTNTIAQIHNKVMYMKISPGLTLNVCYHTVTEMNAVKWVMETCYFLLIRDNYGIKISQDFSQVLCHFNHFLEMSVNKLVNPLLLPKHSCSHWSSNHVHQHLLLRNPFMHPSLDPFPSHQGQSPHLCCRFVVLPYLSNSMQCLISCAWPLLD